MKISRQDLEEIIDEFTSRFSPDETISEYEYRFFRPAIIYMGIKYIKRINAKGVVLYDSAI